MMIVGNSIKMHQVPKAIPERTDDVFKVSMTISEVTFL